MFSFKKNKIRIPGVEKKFKKLPRFPIPFCNHLVSHRIILLANEVLADVSSDATVAAVAKNGAVVDDEFVDDEFDDFSVDKLAYNNGDITGRSLLHGDIHGSSGLPGGLGN